MWVVFLGPPGCGKGTQSEYLVHNHRFSVISTGDLLRANLGRVVDAAAGKTINDIIGSGSLLPDEVTISIIKEELSANDSENILFDGFPRTIVQAEALSVMVHDLGKKIDKVIYFEIDDGLIVKRITGRYKCVRCGKIYNKFFLQTRVDGVCDVCGGTDFEYRTDDNLESLTKRLKEYHGKTQSLIDFYSKSGILAVIDAASSFKDVNSSLLGALYG